MGRKKKKVVKPWCWYCNREFDDDKILIQHQKAKHFKCHICHKKLYTGPGLAIHCMQVHKEAIERIPNSLPNRGSTEIEIYGMEGVPEEDVKSHDSQKLGRTEEPPPKRPREETSYFLSGPPPSIYQMMSGMGGLTGSSPVGVSLPPLPVTGMPQAPVVGGTFLPGAPPAIPGPAPPPYSAPLPPVLPPQPVLSSVANAPMVPMQSTFPAYSSVTPTSAPLPGNAYAGSYPTSKSVTMMSTGTGTKIIHPDEDLSLEERRAAFPQYASKVSPHAGSSSLMANIHIPSMSPPVAGASGSFPSVPPTTYSAPPVSCPPPPFGAGRPPMSTSYAPRPPPY